jgi:hypothetical protein
MAQDETLPRRTDNDAKDQAPQDVHDERAVGKNGDENRCTVVDSP